MNLKVKVFDAGKKVNKVKNTVIWFQRSRIQKNKDDTWIEAHWRCLLNSFLNAILCEAHCHSFYAKSTFECTWSEISHYDTNVDVSNGCSQNTRPHKVINIQITLQIVWCFQWPSASFIAFDWYVLIGFSVEHQIARFIHIDEMQRV